MAADISQLIALLPQHLRASLRPAELKLLHALPAGTVADCRTGNPGADDPAKADAWGPDRVVRAELLAFLCTDPAAVARTHHRGLQLLGARVDGTLYLAGAVLERPLMLHTCALPQGLVLTAARLPVLVLDGSYVGAIEADLLTVARSCTMRGTHATGEVRLAGAKIGGQLNCTGGRFEATRGEPALNGDGIKVASSVLLNQGFQATGEVRLLGAEIGGQLVCTGGRFEHVAGDALNAEGMVVKGSVVLGKTFTTAGRLNLAHARLGMLADDPEAWPANKTLVIDGLEYQRFAGRGDVPSADRIRWLRLQQEFRPGPYDQAAEAFLRMGREGDAVEVRIAKQEDWVRSGQLSWWGVAVRRIAGPTIGHGYKSHQALLWLLALVVLGTLLFWAAVGDGAIARQGDGDAPMFMALLYALDTALPIVDLHQEAFWQVRPQSFWGILGYAYLRVHILVGWALATLFVAGVTGLVRRVER